MCLVFNQMSIIAADNDTDTIENPSCIVQKQNIVEIKIAKKNELRIPNKNLEISSYVKVKTMMKIQKEKICYRIPCKINAHINKHTEREKGKDNVNVKKVKRKK